MATKPRRPTVGDEHTPGTEKPEKPENPEKPEQPEQPGKPGKPEQAGNGAAEFAEALVRHLDRLGGNHRGDEPVLSVTQSRLVMHYGALSNSLGNFGRHGSSRVALLAPSPELNPAQDQLTFPGLEEATVRAGKVAAFFATYGDSSEAPIERGELDLSGSEVVVAVDPAVRIRTVEIEDYDKVPFLLGFVTTPPPIAQY
jgi:hypothetical protein